MDPTTLILTALTAGAAASVKDTASAAIKDSYSGLKALIQRKFRDQPKAQTALDEYEADPDTYEKPLRKALGTSSVDQDEEIITAARQLMTLVQPQAAMGYNIVQNTGNVQGQIVENKGSVTMTFGEIPRRSKSDG
ncbi:MAG: hypothetical protein AUI36_26570 [Cyanobacteria bacterium 13_1_40CM_2_61_4]|nr:MAG: hypothetical protein AUI36_26570 [Cyanobacteria bacterium 13_1_40CM_2_61_4]